MTIECSVYFFSGICHYIYLFHQRKIHYSIITLNKIEKSDRFSQKPSTGQVE